MRILVDEMPHCKEDCPFYHVEGDYGCYCDCPLTYPDHADDSSCWWLVTIDELLKEREQEAIKEIF